MKKNLFIPLGLFVIAIQGVIAQSANQNYIKTITYMNDSGTESMSTIQYYDGLGRPVQTVQAGITPNRSDIITLQEYDDFGRESKTWLPLPQAGNNSAYKNPADLKSAAQSLLLYGNDPKPYSETVYEPSPLNRVIKQFGPGNDWYSGAGHPVATDYRTNNTTDIALKCQYFYLSGNTLMKNGFYDAGQLYVTEIRDEDGKVTCRFTDKLDRLVMTRQLLAATATAQSCVDTYYVYDDFGNLCYVLPPLAVDNLGSGSSWTESSDVLQKYAYLYKYDARNRQTQKRLPGCDWQYMVYDKADRLVFSQDGNQRLKNQWTFNKYDELGRLIITGIHTTGQTHSALIQQCQNIVVSETYNGGFYGYSWNVLPEIPYTGTLMVYYYDDYNRVEQHGGISAILRYETKSGYGTRYINAGLGSKSAKGLLVGTRAKILGGSGEIITATYYDDRGRVIQTRSTNHLGGYDITYNAYDFIGNIKQTLIEHSTNDTHNNPLPEQYRYLYDHAGRLTDTWYTPNMGYGSEILLAHNTYDELGRLKEKKRHDQSDTERFEYNIRNWTTKIQSGTTFEENLYYNTNLPTNSIACYNGNISATSWKYNGETNLNTYEYDLLNRLTFGGDIGTYSWSEYFNYDKNGNITFLQRGGNHKEEGTIDYLNFGYC